MSFWSFINTIFNIVVYGVIGIIAIFIIYRLYDFIKKESEKCKELNNYKNTIPSKYRRFSDSKKVEIYNRIVKLKKSYADGEIANKKAKETRGEAQMDFLIQAMAPSMIQETIEKDYGIKLHREYLDYDIEHLKKYIK